MKEEVTNMIADLQLVDKTKSPSSQLSGGMKRKLRWVGRSGQRLGGKMVVFVD